MAWLWDYLIHDYTQDITLNAKKEKKEKLNILEVAGYDNQFILSEA